MIEILVVMAITSILLLLVFGPLIQSFNLTREAQAEAVAQDTARRLIDDVSKELANATFIRDSSGRSAGLEIIMPEEYFAVTLPEAQRHIYLPYAKIDFYPPSQGNPGDPQYNPYVGKQDPTLKNKGPIGTLNLPLARGISMVRYFIGLQDPTQEYRNTAEQKLVRATLGDNLFVLYRAEVIPVLANGQVNTEFFDVGPDGQPVYDDPTFFTATSTDTAAKRQRIQSWRNASTTVSIVDRMDLINVVRDLKSKDVIFDPNGRPQVSSLLSFQPQRVEDEPMSQDTTTSLGEEFPNKVPSGYNSLNGGWTDSYGVTIYRDPLGGTDKYWTDEEFINNKWHRIVWHQFQSIGGNPESERVFDITKYMDSVQAGTPDLKTATYQPLNSQPLMFTVDQETGKLSMTFDRQSWTITNPWLPSTGLALTWQSDLNPDPTTVNGAYNYQYRNHPQWDRRIQRFIRLRDDMDSPLALWKNATIVPGTEVVIGPDQRPGVHYGAPICFRRVPSLSTEMGPNQYRINYTALPFDPVALKSQGFDPNDPEVLKYIMPRFEPGYIQFYSDPYYPMPEGTRNIQVSYRFQLNTSADIATVDYSTREVLLINMAVRKFTQGASTAHMTTLTNKVKVRNFLR